MTASLVKPKTCRRCAGTGTVSVRVRRAHLGVPGLCFACDGAGVVEGDRATLAARKAAAEALAARWAIAVAWFAAQSREVRAGFDVLEVLEPARADRALESIEAGHPAVAAALVEYGTANAARCWEQLHAARR